MNAKPIDTYDKALTAIRTDGHLFDTGQIAHAVTCQLIWAAKLGEVVEGRDSWPIRGYPEGSGERKTVWTLGRRATDGGQTIVSDGA